MDIPPDSTDGYTPAAVTSVSALGMPGSIFVRWDRVTLNSNGDAQDEPVEYRVYVIDDAARTAAGGAGWAVGAELLAGVVTDSGWFIAKEQDGVALDPELQYYFKVQSADDDGAAAASSEYGPITTDEEGVIRAPMLETTLALVSVLATGDGSAVSEFQLDGINNRVRAYNDDGDVTFEVDGATGDVTIVGTFKTGTSGARIELDKEYVFDAGAAVVRGFGAYWETPGQLWFENGITYGRALLSAPQEDPDSDQGESAQIEVMNIGTVHPPNREVSLFGDTIYANGILEVVGPSVFDDYWQIREDTQTGFSTYATPTIEQRKTASSASGSSISATWDAATDKNSTCLMAIRASGTTAPTGFTPPSGWKLVATDVNGGVRGSVYKASGAVRSGAEAVTIVGGSGTILSAMAIYEVSGISADWEVFAHSSGSSATASTGTSATTPADKAFLFGMVTALVGFSGSPSGSYTTEDTVQISGNDRMRTASKIITSQATAGFTQALASSDKWAGVVVGFRTKLAATPAADTLRAHGTDLNGETRLTLVSNDGLDRYLEGYEVLNRTILGAPADTVGPLTIPFRRFLRLIIFAIPTGGTIAAQLRFNGDSGANYADRHLDTGGEATDVNAGGIFLDTGAAVNRRVWITCDVVNLPGEEKQVLGMVMDNGSAGAGTAPSRRIIFAKWAVTTGAILSVEIVNGGAGDFDTGSELVILGHN